MFNNILLGVGIYLCFVSIICTANGILSKIVIKALPFFCGLYCIFMFLILQGYVTIK